MQQLAKISYLTAQLADLERVEQETVARTDFRADPSSQPLTEAPGTGIAFIKPSELELTFSDGFVDSVSVGGGYYVEQLRADFCAQNASLFECVAEGRVNSGLLTEAEKAAWAKIE